MPTEQLLEFFRSKFFDVRQRDSEETRGHELGDIPTESLCVRTRRCLEGPSEAATSSLGLTIRLIRIVVAWMLFDERAVDRSQELRRAVGDRSEAHDARWDIAFERSPSFPEWSHFLDPG